MKAFEGGDSATDERIVSIDRAKIVDEKDVWVSMKGDLCLANEEVVRRDAYVEQFTKCNDLKATNTTLRMKYRLEHHDTEKFLFRSVFIRREFLQSL